MTVPLILAAIAGAAAVIGALAFAGEWLRHRMRGKIQTKPEETT